MPDNKEYVQISTAAKMLGVSIDTLRRWDKAGRISSIRLDEKNRYFKISDLQALKNQQNLKTTDAAHKLGVSVDTLIRYEKNGLISVPRNAHGERIYSTETLQTLEKIIARTKRIQPSPQENETKTIYPYSTVSQNTFFASSSPSLGSSFSAPAPPQKTSDPPDPPSETAFSPPPSLPSSSHFKKKAFVALLPFLVLIPGLFLASNYTSKNNNITEYIKKGGQVLAASTQQLNSKLTFNIPTIFTNNVTIDGAIGLTVPNGNITVTKGSVTAPNLIYSVTGGNGITVTGGQNPVVSFNGVTSLGGQTGDLTLTAGNGISVDGTTITNNDTGSGQKIFKTIKVGSDSFDAGSNTDTLTFAAGNNITLTTDTDNKKITIAAGGAADSGWTHSNTNIYTTISSDQVGIGTSTPTEALDVTGNIRSSASFIIGGQSVSSVAGNGLNISSGTLGVGILSAADGTTGTTSSFSGLQFSGADGKQLSLLQGCSDGQLLKWDAASNTWMCASDQGGSTGVINVKNGTTSYTSIDTINFETPDFSVTRVGNEARATIDYTNSHITRNNQSETIASSWTFSSGLSGTTLNATTGLQTAGTTRVDASGNLTNIGTTQFNDVTYTWPGADGGANSFLTTDGSGTLSWTDSSLFNLWQQTNNSLAPKNITNALNIGATATSSALVHLPGTNNQNAFFNLGTGNLGVDNTNPTHKLDVNGTLAASGTVTFSSLGTGVVHADSGGNLSIGSVTNGELANSSIDVNLGSGLSGDSSVSLGGTLNINNTGVLSLTAGSGVSVSGSTGDITIANTGVTSFQGNTGSVTLTAGSGIGIVGTTISNSGVTSFQGNAGDITLTNGTGISITGTTIGVNTSVPTSVNNDTNVTGSISANALTLGWSGTLAPSRGGTGIGSYTAGDLLYASNTNTLSSLSAGTGNNGKVLSVSSGLPAWVDPATIWPNYFQRNDQAVSPKDITDDILTGAIATTSALVRLPGTNNQSAFFNLGTGNLGVGLTNPTHRLDVSGTGNISGNVTLGSDLGVTGNSILTGNLGVNGGNITSTGTLLINPGSTLEFYNSNNTINSSGDLTLAGTINGTALQTNATDRIDNSGNLKNIGTTEFAGTTYTWPTSPTLSDGYALTTDATGHLSWTDVSGGGGGGGTITAVGDVTSGAAFTSGGSGTNLYFHNSGHTGQLLIGTLSGNQTYTLPDESGTICLDSGNCASSGGGVTTSGGTSNFIPKFSGSQTLIDSSLFDNGNVGIGDTTPASLFTVGNGDLFQVNSSGAIAAATGIASSGTITFSGLGTGIIKSTGGTLGLATAGTDYQTPLTAGTDYEIPLTFNNGLTRSTNTIGLGGTLSSDTTIANGGHIFAITGTGNIGIGTSVPGSYKLNVNGNTNITGTLTTSGAITAPTSSNTINGLVINAGSISSGTGISSSGNIDLSSLSSGGIVKAAASTGRLSIATPGTDYQTPLTAGTDYEVPLTFSTGLNRASNIITNTGVLSLAGTTNQISVNTSTGNITLSLPQNINTGATPTFSGLTLSSFTLGSDTVTDLTGTGLQVSGGILSTTLGTSVDLTSEVTNTLPAGNGGTGFSSYAIGNLLYANTTTSLAKLAIGTPGQVLTVNGSNLPEWSDSSSLNFWQRNDGALAPLQSTNDLLIGGSATSSAHVKIPGTNNQNAFFNLGTGNVGIGLTNPTHKLDVSGTTNISGAVTFGSTLQVTSDTTLTGDLAVNGGDITSTSTLTLNPTTAVQFFSSSNSIDSSGNLLLAGSVNAGSTINGTALQTNATDRIDNSGNLKNIGTTQFAGTTYTWPNPSNQSSNYVLTTNGSGTLSWQSVTGVGAGTGTITAIGDVTSGNAFTSSGTNGTSLYFADSGSHGELTIGTLSGDQTYTLPDASGTICLDSGNCAGSGGGVTTSGGTTNFIPKFTGSQVLSDSSIFDNGNVGIGTSTPGSYKLNVNGNTNITGTLNVTSAITAPTSSNTINGLVINSGAISSGTGLSSSGNIDFSSLSSGGLVKAAASTGRLSIAVANTDYQTPLTAGTDYEVPLTFSTGLNRASNVITNTGVLSFQGSTGTITLSNGSGIGISGTTISNTGVLSLAGTTNQISVNTSTGNITLSLPQNIDTGATPTFSGLTLSGITGNNAVLFATSGTGVLTSASTNTTDLCLVSGSSAPTWDTCPGSAGGSDTWQEIAGALSPSNSTDDVLIGGTATSSALIKFPGLTNHDAFINLGTGNLGIGNTNPNAKLDVNGNILVQGGGSIDTRAAGTLTIGGSTQTALTLGRSGQSTTLAGNVQAFTLAGNITGSGTPNITSIGQFSGATGVFSTSTTTPLIIGGTSASSSLTLQSTSGTGSTDFIKFLVGNNGATEAMRITTSGNLGIGTSTPGSKLQVNGAAAIGYSSSTTAPSNGLAVSGNVGIGTTTTNAQLTVNGATSLQETTAPSNTSGYGKIYASSSDHALHYVDNSGNDTNLSQVKQLTQNFIVETGKSVSAGDVVSYINGHIARVADSILTTSGNPQTFDSSGTSGGSSSKNMDAAQIDATHFVIAYVDQGSSDNGVAVIGTISGTSISYGTPSTFNAAATTWVSVTGVDSTHFAVSYSTSSAGVARVASVSGTTISWGSASTFYSTNSLSYSSITTMDSTHVVVGYSDTSVGFAARTRAASISGTTLSWGTEVVVQSSASDTSVVSLSSNTFIATYLSGSTAFSKVGSLSGTTISYTGTSYSMDTSTPQYFQSTKISSTSFALIYEYGSGGSIDDIYSKIGSISGTVISFGSSTLVVSSGGATNGFDISTMDSTHIVVAYEANLSDTYTRIGTVSGTSVTYSSALAQTSSGQTYFVTVAGMSSTQFVVAYQEFNSGTFQYNGKAETGNTQQGPILGIAKISGNAGDTVPVIIDGVSDVQSGLTAGTTYYIDDQGNLTTTTTSNVAGLALSSTELQLNNNTDYNQYFGDAIFANNFRITEASGPFQGLIFKNQLGENILNLDEFGNLSVNNNVSAGSITTQGIQYSDFKIVENDNNLLTIEANSDEETPALFSLDQTGNATFSGTLTAQNVTAQNGTIGTLHVNNLIADNISSLNSGNSSTFSAALDTLNAKVDLNTDTLASVSAQLNKLEALNLAPFIASDSADTTITTINNGLLVMGTTSLNDVSANSLTIGTTMKIDGSSINSLGQTLAIEPLQQADVDIMGGAVVIKTDGTLHVAQNAEFAKDVKVQGVLSANTIQGLNGTLNVSGSATLDKVNLTNPDTTVVSDTEVSASGSAGLVTLKANQTQLKITDPKVTNNSLIFLTPKTETDAPLFIKQQVNGQYFIVGIKSAQTEDINFNFLIVN